MNVVFGYEYHKLIYFSSLRFEAIQPKANKREQIKNKPRKKNIYGTRKHTKLELCEHYCIVWLWSAEILEMQLNLFGHLFSCDNGAHSSPFSIQSIFIVFPNVLCYWFYSVITIWTFTKRERIVPSKML